MVANLEEYKKNRQKNSKKLITDEEDYEIWMEMNILKKIKERNNLLNNSLKLVK